MKARVKATGEIIEVATYSAVYELEGTGRRFNFDEVELVEDDSPVGPNDYWTRLEHQAAIAAMQGLLQSPHLNIMQEEPLVGMAGSIAHALVEKLKENKI